MLVRFLLAVMIAAFSLPAMASAPCHDGMPMAAMTMPVAAVAAVAARHPAPRPMTMAAHDCIGCVPPSSWRSASVAVPVPARAAAPVALPLAFNRLPPARPATPPPRA